MLRNRLIYLSALCVAVLFYSFYSPWASAFVLWLTLSLPLFSLLCSLGAVTGKTLEIQLPEECSLGESARCAIRIAGKGSAMPVCRVKLMQRDILSGEKNSSDALLWGRGEWNFHIPCEHCGCIAFMAEKARAYDMLGLFSFSVKLPPASRLFVMPEVRRPKQLPDLSLFRSLSWKDKPGGGFSEVHELRPYRPGDALRDVHWKISAKSDELMVRQAQEREELRLSLSLDRPAERDRCDAVLGEFLWLSSFLLEKELRHRVYWYNDGLKCSEISSLVERDAFLKELLSTAVDGDAPSLESTALPDADWHYHISGRERGERQ